MAFKINVSKFFKETHHEERYSCKLKTQRLDYFVIKELLHI